MSNYYIGLDIGTDSVGWAVTDSEYHILKKHGKALWGVRLFGEANKAEERRSFRTARRRLERRNQRIEWLREIFSKEIAKVDPAFFLRVDESKYIESDKKTQENGASLGRYTLFADKSYCDKDYHREFPTIYHLRRALMLEDRSFDVRLVYLAVHHILKKRGHFLFDNISLEDVTFDRCMNDLQQHLIREYDIEFEISDRVAFSEVLTDRSLGISRKKAALRKAAGVGKDQPQLCAIVDLLAGAKVKASVVSGIEFSNEEDRSFSFSDNYENTEAEIAELLGDDMQLIHQIKKLYDFSILDELKNGESYISCAKVKVYEQHERDLAQLKSLIKPHKKLYREMFRQAQDKLDNYVAYSGHGAQNYRCDYTKFCAYAKKQLKTLLPKLEAEGKQEAEYIIEALDIGLFLPKQTSKDNGVIPHQLHEQELEIILERAGQYLSFLNETDGSGLNRKQQILEMFRFRVPYYVGPLNRKSSHAWIVRGSDKIYPWNFEKIVDIPRTAEEFITRMTATCSYIGDPVLPKDSLLYSKFVALNMINKICINGKPISVETKQRIFNDHLLVQGNSNGKKLKEFLLSNGLMDKKDEISGIDSQFKIQLTGYHVFQKILSRGNSYFMVEDIIRHIVLYGEDRKLLQTWLSNAYGSALSEDDRRYILNRKNRFSGWGNLSEAFLMKIEHTNSETGEISSIMKALWNTNHNLMELLSGQFTFAQAVEKYRAEKYGLGERTLDTILKDSYASPGIRRAIHQTIGIVSEIEKIMAANLIEYSSR